MKVMDDRALLEPRPYLRQPMQAESVLQPPASTGIEPVDLPARCKKEERPRVVRLERSAGMRPRALAPLDFAAIDCPAPPNPDGGELASGDQRANPRRIAIKFASGFGDGDEFGHSRTIADSL